MNTQGVLLINLGSPDSTAVPDVRKYLREFLMDGRVIDLPWPMRALLVNGAILPTRPKQSAEAYEKIWTDEGSPLVTTTRNVREKLQSRLAPDVLVDFAMRYQNPRIEWAITNLQWKGVRDLLVVPLFPHYAMSSYETAAIRVRELVAKIAPEMQVRVLEPYYDHAAYIRALAASAADYLTQEHDHLLFSFHGVPERHLRKSDTRGSHCLHSKACCETKNPAHQTCYRAQCFGTVKAFAAATGIAATKYSVAFQSRLGRDPWLKPYTDAEIVRLAQGGVKKLLVICPAFVSDCLETLEEIAIRGRELFLEAGGKEFTLIPCLNEHPQWLDSLEEIIRENMLELV